METLDCVFTLAEYFTAFKQQNSWEEPNYEYCITARVFGSLSMHVCVSMCARVWVMKPGEHLMGNLLNFTRVSPFSLPALLTHMWKVLRAPLRKLVSCLSSQSPALLLLFSRWTSSSSESQRPHLPQLQSGLWLAFLSFHLRRLWVPSQFSLHLWQFSPGAPDPPKAHKRDHETDWRL